MTTVYIPGDEPRFANYRRAVKAAGGCAVFDGDPLRCDALLLPGGGADGVYGSATISAVADFQQWVNDQRGEETLTVNGEVDQLTLLYLQYCKDHGMMP